MSKIFFHVDVNSAFLSWSAIKHLRDGEDVDLRTIPAVVGGDEAQRHGVVLAKSGPAKKYGIKTGESLFAARTKYPLSLIHICIGTLIVTTTLQIPSSIFTESYLSFLGLGVAAPMPSLGSLATDAVKGMNTYPCLLYTSLASAAPRSPYRHLELCGIALEQKSAFLCR